MAALPRQLNVHEDKIRLLLKYQLHEPFRSIGLRRFKSRPAQHFAGECTIVRVVLNDQHAQGYSIGQGITAGPPAIEPTLGKIAASPAASFCVFSAVAGTVAVRPTPSC